MQSWIAIDNGRGRALLLAPGITALAISGLLPRRHYRIEGAATGFLRADEQGDATLAIDAAERALIALWPVV